MSSALAISAVTATLRNLLTAGTAGDGELADTAFTTQPPDKARTGTTNQLNLFLYQTTPNGAWRNQPLPPARDGEIAPFPLSLDLHYLLTAYGRGDDDVLGHRLLGRAMSVLHGHPVLGPGELHDALVDPDNDVDAQPERVRITPATLTIDEMSKLWTTFQTQYRISAAYRVSVVLLQAAPNGRAALPVLTRNPTAQGDVLPPLPAVTAVAPPNGQAVARLGDELTLSGHHLDGDTVTVLFQHALLAAPRELTPTATTAETLTVALPDAAAGAADWPAGVYGVSVVVTTAGRDQPSMGSAGLVLAPTIQSIAPDPAPRDGAGDVALTVDFVPLLRPRQLAALVVGSTPVPIAPVSAATGSVTVTVAGLPAGDAFVRLRIDVAESVLVDRSTTPPSFDPTQKVTIT
jgi:Pvc16 N-terminal domain